MKDESNIRCQIGLRRAKQTILFEPATVRVNGFD